MTICNPLNFVTASNPYDPHIEQKYFQALLISDKIYKAQYYNQTWANVPLFEPLDPTNQQILLDKGFKLQMDGQNRLLVMWE